MTSSLRIEPIQGVPDLWTKPCQSDMFKKLFRKLSGSKRTKLPHLLEGSELDPFFKELDYFPRPEWSRITEYIESTPEEERGPAWQDFAYHWLHRLAAHLGEPYRIDWSKEFILLSPREPWKAKLLLEIVEAQREKILNFVGTDEREEGYGFHTLLLFEEIDTYQRYISHFGPSGIEASSGGMFIGNEYYGHITLFGSDARILELVTAHELTHNLLWPSYLPLWVEEGVCQAMEQRCAGHYREAIGRKRAQEHRLFWLDYGLKRFWEGAAFRCPEAQEYAYELALLLVKVLAERSSKFKSFLEFASWQDAGFEACKTQLGFPLEEAVSGFLGEGLLE